MYIYKITNKINGKIYIGQVYNKTIQDRFNRHIKDASPHSRSIVDKAIDKYGKDNFTVEQIDTATTLEELNQKEMFWIKYYNSTDRSIGYNLTDGGDGGNTYKYKSKDEMKAIKEKIAKSNFGKNNGMHKSIKGFNVKTKEEVFFDTLSEACRYFGIIQKDIFTLHAMKKAKYLYKDEWVFAYTDDEYNLTLGTFDSSTRNGTKVKLTNLNTGEEQIFNSICKLCESLGFNSKHPIDWLNKKLTGSYIVEKL